MNSVNSFKKQQGISLLELAILTSLLAVIAGIGFGAFNKQQTRNDYLVTESSIFAAEDILVNYLQTNLRLPCPDTNQDGKEDCGSRYGTLPYDTLGLDGVITDAWNQPIRYQVSSVLSSTNATNMYTLCQHIRTNEVANAGQTGFTLISGGLKDYDNGQLSDGNVDTVSQVGTELIYNRENTYLIPGKTERAISDDRAVSKGLVPLLGELNCTGLLVAANSMESQIRLLDIQREAFNSTIGTLDGTLSDLYMVRVSSGVNMAVAAAQAASAVAGNLDGAADATSGDPSTMSAVAASAIDIAAAAVAVASSIEALVNAEKTEDRAKSQKSKVQEYIGKLNSTCNTLRTFTQEQKGSAISCD